MKKLGQWSLKTEGEKMEKSDRTLDIKNTEEAKNKRYKSFW